MDGDAGAAVTASIRRGWFKFRSRASLLVPCCCEGIFMPLTYGVVYYTEVWSLKRENELAQHQA